MDKIIEIISSLSFVIILQAAVIIPLTILALWLRQWIILGVRKVRYAQKQKRYEKYGFDLLQIPEDLHTLIPFAKEFGIADSQDRKKRQEEVTSDQKMAFVRAVRGKEDEIVQWLKAIYPHISIEASAYAYMLKSMSEMDLLVEYHSNTLSDVNDFTGAAPLAPKARIIFYQPRPKNGVEKFVYDLFMQVIAVIIFPVFYFMIAKVWALFSPREESVVAFGIICTLAGLLSIFTIKSAAWVIKRARMNYTFF